MGAGALGDRYELLAVPGRKGSSEVVQAIDHQHDRVVALKLRTSPPTRPARTSGPPRVSLNLSEMGPVSRSLVCSPR